MLVGDYVIANDLLGVVVDSSEDTLTIRDESGVDRTISAESCHEIVSGFALAASVYVKLRKRVNSEKNKG